MRCNELSGFLDMLPLGITLSELALVEGGGTHTWILKYLWPGIDLVQVAPRRLLIYEVQVVGELFESNLSGELCQRTIGRVEIVFAGGRM